MQIYFWAFVVAVCIAYFCTPQVKLLAVRAGAIDDPEGDLEGRKVHKLPIPRMGGLAIYVAFVLAVMASIHIDHEIAGLLIGGTVILIVGIVDDLWQLSARVKLFGQIMAAVILVLFDIRIEWITNPWGGNMVYVAYFSIPLTILWVVGLTNTINLIDGLDGLATGVSIIAAVTISLVALEQHIILIAILTIALAGSSLGFLQYNFNPAKIFMGDTGSMFLGYMLGAISILGAVKSAATIALIVPIMALGLPIMDTAFAIIRRWMNGSPIFKADKGHLHHCLLAMGLTHRQAVLLMYVISGCLGLSAIALTEVNMVIGALIVIVVFTAAFIGAKRIGVLKTNKSLESS